MEAINTTVKDHCYIAFGVGPLGVGEIVAIALVLLLFFGGKHIPAMVKAVVRFPVEVMRGGKSSRDEESPERRKRD